MSACAAVGQSWKEEALQSDGNKIIVERTVKNKGRHEVAQQPPIGEQSLSFTLPGIQEKVVWEDPFSPDIGSASFLPMLLEAKGEVAYLVVEPMGCPSYYKWGSPNPPYVIFKYQNRQWTRIPLQDLPPEIKTPNLIFSMPAEEARSSGEAIVSAETIKKLYAGYRNPEHRTIVRDELPQQTINEMCEQRVLYKGYWILPNDPVARKIDQRKQ